MIGILGGTFDPIHNGHTHIAAQACARLGLEQVQFMPCAQPVHRAAPRVSAEQRCAMIEVALADNPRYVLNRIEIDRAGPSFTVDSLNQISAQQAQPLALLLGGDAFNGFADWKQPRQILDLANLVICVRPGIDLDAGVFADRRVDSVREFADSNAGSILVLEVDAPDCSSSEVRAAIAVGDIPRRWLSPAVADYIESNHLYRSSVD